jgi:hypothetical protein
MYRLLTVQLTTDSLDSDSGKFAGGPCQQCQQCPAGLMMATSSCSTSPTFSHHVIICKRLMLTILLLCGFDI